MRLSPGSRRVSWILLTLLAGSVRAQDVVYVSVRGIAWDSLRNAPLSGAFVGIAGTSRTALSDARGRFRIDSIAAGTYTFTMQHDMLDSIGFSGRSARASLDATHYSVTVAVPSFATLWRGLCGGPPPKDSGIVYGVVQDVSDQPLPGAQVGVVWKDVRYRRSTGFDWKDMGGQTVADSTGRYALCGVPLDIGINVAAAKDSLASAVVELPPLTLRISRRDLRLAPKGRESSETGTVMGMLTGKAGAPIAGAIVVIEGVPEGRTGDDGRFVLRDVPAGTRQLDARAVGASPTRAIVDVAPNDTVRVTLELGRVQTLDAVRVSAPTFAQVQIRNIEERRATGIGYFRDSALFQRLPTIPAAFEGIAGLQTRNKNAFVLWNKRSVDNCPLQVWIDKMHLDVRALELMRPDEFATIEVFLNESNTPPEFQSREGRCGAVVVFTKRFLRR